jgi:hypothetical protein
MHKKPLLPNDELEWVHVVSAKLLGRLQCREGGGSPGGHTKKEKKIY